MKISDVTVRRFSEVHPLPDMAAGRETLVVEVHCDEGVRGTGFVSISASRHGTTGDLAATFIRRNLRNVVLGQNPLLIDELWRRMIQSTWRAARGRFSLLCISAIDSALYDLKARLFKVPVCEMLGGRRERIPTYCTAASSASPQKLAEKATELAGAGHKAIKIRGSASAVSLAEATERVRCVREAIGPDVRLMVDVNGTWDSEIAIRQLKAWERYDLYWLEEPCPVDDVAGYVRVRKRAGRTYIVGGENHAGMLEFRALIEGGAVDIVQPNAWNAGGVTAWLQAYHLAVAHGLPVSPWQCQEINLHLAAAFPGVLWIEWVPRGHGGGLFKAPVFRETRTEEGVFLMPPAEPGFGLVLDEAVAERIEVKE